LAGGHFHTNSINGGFGLQSGSERGNPFNQDYTRKAKEGFIYSRKSKTDPPIVTSGKNGADLAICTSQAHRSQRLFENRHRPSETL
jgi:hypothetical protein